MTHRDGIFLDKPKCNRLSKNNLVVPTQTIIAKGDSGASQHCFALNSQNALKNVIQVPRPNIILPNQEKIQAVAIVNIPIKNFSKQATTTYLLKDLTDTNLVSLGQLCDDDCHILLTKKKLHLYKKQEQR